MPRRRRPDVFDAWNQVLDRVPDLRDMDGVRLAHLGGSATTTRTSGLIEKRYTVLSESALSDIASVIARQLSNAGWELDVGGTSDAISWGRWTAPGEDGAVGWVLVHNSPGTQRRLVTVQLIGLQGDVLDDVRLSLGWDKAFADRSDRHLLRRWWPRLRRMGTHTTHDGQTAASRS